MADQVNLTVDGIAVAVPKGTLIVDAAKKIQNDIPVFCYHPKLKPVGMCRMCLVEVGTPKIDPATKQVVMGEDGKPVITMIPKLQTACTTPVSEGMVVKTGTAQVKDAREDVLEFLLTSHPLDCPICDKGGECPLQNLTIAYGPGVSRFDYADKQHNDKHVPLGELVFLDRERCIMCARCVRFEDEIADDHVLGIHDRGRYAEIITMSDPGFDSYFSGCTTDICPVGALTTSDFRFKARPWELESTQSICNHCPVGCNTTLNTRLDTKTGGHEIKRVMPRQNEQVNEIWMCDKGRFVHHYTRAQDRLKQPLMRKDGKLQEVTWEQAMLAIGEKLKASANTVGVIGDRIANEDAYLFGKLMKLAKGTVSISPSIAAGYADVARTYGVGAGTDLKQLGKGDVIVVVNADVEESAPVWFLQLKAAVTDRGATLIVAHSHSTKMHRYAKKILRYDNGMAAKDIIGSAEISANNETLKGARNLLFVFGDEQLDAPSTRALAQHLANVLIDTGHAGKANSGLLPMYAHGNTQGVYDMTTGDGRRTTDSVSRQPSSVDVAWLVGVGAAADAPKAGFTIVQELFLTDLAMSADIVLPALSYAEREGTYTSGDRRVQRFYRALPATGQAKPDWWVFQEAAKQLGTTWTYWSTQQIFDDLSANITAYAGLNYDRLSQSEVQWPPMGREDLYYGGTVYDNTGGLGVRYAADAERAGFAAQATPVSAPDPSIAAMQRKPRALYQQGELTKRSAVIQQRIEGSSMVIPLAAK